MDLPELMTESSCLLDPPSSLPILPMTLHNLSSRDGRHAACLWSSGQFPVLDSDRGTTSAHSDVDVDLKCPLSNPVLLAPAAMTAGVLARSSGAASNGSEAVRMLKAAARARRLQAIQTALEGYEGTATPAGDNGNTANPPALPTGSSAAEAVDGGTSAVTGTPRAVKREQPVEEGLGEKTTKKARIIEPQKDSVVLAPRFSLQDPNSETTVLSYRMHRDHRGANAKPSDIFLSKEQVAILELARQGHSLFYTGSAGERVVRRAFARLIAVSVVVLTNPIQVLASRCCFVT